MTSLEINLAIRNLTGIQRDDFDSDLNAMHQAVSGLRCEDANDWADELTKITVFGANPRWTHWYHLANASARERAEAFLRVKGLWK